MSLTEQLQTFQNDKEMLELFGQVTLAKRSWFRFVRYSKEVYIDVFIDEKQLEVFDNFENALTKLKAWEESYESK